jgi:hypothetical protein
MGRVEEASSHGGFRDRAILCLPLDPLAELLSCLEVLQTGVATAKDHVSALSVSVATTEPNMNF